MIGQQAGEVIPGDQHLVILFKHRLLDPDRLHEFTSSLAERGKVNGKCLAIGNGFYSTLERHIGFLKLVLAQIRCSKVLVPSIQPRIDFDDLFETGDRLGIITFIKTQATQQKLCGDIVFIRFQYRSQEAFGFVDLAMARQTPVTRPT